VHCGCNARALAVKRAHLVDRCGLAEPEGPLLCRPAIGAFFRKKRRAKVRLGLLGYSTSPTLICRKATRQARRSGVSTVVWDRSIAARGCRTSRWMADQELAESSRRACLLLEGKVLN